MIDLATVLAEKQARDRDRAAITAAVRAKFEITRKSADRVQRMRVYLACAEALKEEAKRGLFVRVTAIVVKLGVRPAVFPPDREVPGRLFLGVREKNAAPRPDVRKPLTPREVGRLQREWYARIRDDVEPERDDGYMPRWPTFNKFAETINTAFFERQAESYWQQKAELDVWQLYAIEGLSAREVAAKLGINRNTVQKIVRVMQARQPITTGLRSQDGDEEGNDDAEEEELDGAGGA